MSEQVTLGGKERALFYGTLEGVEILRRTGGNKGILKLMREDFLGVDDEGKPTANTRLDVQLTVLWAGLRSDPRITFEKVAEWVNGHLQERKPLTELLTPVWRAVCLSGILGVVIDPDESPEGKASPAPEAPAAG